MGKTDWFLDNPKVPFLKNCFFSKGLFFKYNDSEWRLGLSNSKMTEKCIIKVINKTHAKRNRPKLKSLFSENQLNGSRRRKIIRITT